MPRITLDPSRSALAIIDVQSALMPYIDRGEALLDRIAFLIKVAKLLEVPVLATEQNPDRMGRTDASIMGMLEVPHAKMCFGACGCAGFMSELEGLGRRQVIVLGVETHICVSQTAQGLLERGYEVVVCPDGVSARSQERHKLGMERIRDAGCVPAHTEAVAYEWMGSAEHPRFREALAIVKAHP